MDITILVTIALVCVVTGWFLGRFTAPERKRLSRLNEEVVKLRADNAAWERRGKEYREETDKQNQKISELREETNKHSREQARLEADYKNLLEKMRKERGEMESLHERFEKEFQNLANKILEEKSQKFTHRNEEKIGALLKPMKERIEKFEKKVGDTYEKQMRDSEGLKTEVKKLYELNQHLGEEARNLTRALTNESKSRGNWGELVLETILEESGLNKGQEFFVQESLKTENGQRQQPDVVLKLPGGKHIIVDSKVSLVDYEKYTAEEDHAQQKRHLKQHLRSVREHVRGLAKKDYNKLHGVNGLDFVLLFVPIEPAYQLALRHDSDLFHNAFNDQIVLVGPTTLMVTLKTIAISWRHEYQNQNVLEIAKEGGALYDKFVSFVEELEKVGSHLEKTQGVYEDSMKKLVSGKGNLVKRAEKLRELGSRAKKKLPGHLIDTTAATNMEEDE